MSHHIYKTEALVISSSDRGENNKVFSLFTPDLGRLSVHAQGIRKIKSKMSGHLFDLNHLEVALVRGRELWRVTGAESTDLYGRVSQTAQNKKTIKKMINLIDRLILGEGDTGEVFRETLRAIEFLSERDLEDKDRQAFENIVTLRILHHSGYIDRDDGVEDLIVPCGWEDGILKSYWKKEELVQENIFNALEHSHL